MSTKKKEPATSESVKVQIDALTMRNAWLENQLKLAAKENVTLKTALKEIEADYSAKITNQLKLDIQNVLGLSDIETFKLTSGKSVEELEGMLKNFMIAKGNDVKTGKATFKPLVPGGKIKMANDLTVGCLFGKTSKEIREMGGDFP